MTGHAMKIFRRKVWGIVPIYAVIASAIPATVAFMSVWIDSYAVTPLFSEISNGSCLIFCRAS